MRAMPWQGEMAIKGPNVMKGYWMSRKDLVEEEACRRVRTGT